MGLDCRNFIDKKMWWYTVYASLYILILTWNQPGLQEMTEGPRKKAQRFQIWCQAPWSYIFVCSAWMTEFRCVLQLTCSDGYVVLICSNHFFGLCAIHLFSDIHDEDIRNWPTIVTDGGSEDFLDLGQIKGFAFFSVCEKACMDFWDLLYYISRSKFQPIE